MGILGELFKSFITFGIHDPYQRDIPDQHGGHKEPTTHEEREGEQNEPQENEK